MIPKHLKEENPRRRLYRKRIRKWPEIIGKRFFAGPTICGFGFFTVKKVWRCMVYYKAALHPLANGKWTHWSAHYTIEIETDAGERLIMHKLQFDLDETFKECYEKRK